MVNSAGLLPNAKWKLTLEPEKNNCCFSKLLIYYFICRFLRAEIAEGEHVPDVRLFSTPAPFTTIAVA